jgi:hypothetical protein
MTSTQSVVTDATALDLARKQLDTDGYAVVRDSDLGLPAGIRDHIHRTYFNAEHLRRYEFDIPSDRERARDVIRYTWTDGRLDMAEHDTVAIEGRGDQPFRREFDRVELLADHRFCDWIAIALALVPTGRRHEQGTFGVNLFRTHTKVVTKPHQDGEEYVLIYVLERVGSGAESMLYRVDSDEVVHHSTLEPGDLIIFRDSAFRHTATPLVPPPGGVAHRDVLVCTVNYPDTYPIHD